MPDIEITDPWKLSSGLRDDMVLSITDAYFAPDAEYQGGRVLLLHLIGLDEMQEAQTIKMSVGADWETSDGGVTITHPTKKQQKINASTIYGHWISHAQEIPELVKELQDRPGGPLNSKVWEGLIIHLQERDLVFGKNIDPQKRLMPTEYFGLLSNTAPATMAPVSAPPVATAPPLSIPAVPPAAAPPTNGAPSAVDTAALIAQARAAQAAPAPTGSPLYDKYVTLARSTEWGPFLAAALADPEVLLDDEFAGQVIGGTLYAQARA